MFASKRRSKCNATSDFSFVENLSILIFFVIVFQMGDCEKKYTAKIMFDALSVSNNSTDLCVEITQLIYALNFETFRNPEASHLTLQLRDIC